MIRSSSGSRRRRNNRQATAAAKPPPPRLWLATTIPLLLSSRQLFTDGFQQPRTPPAASRGSGSVGVFGTRQQQQQQQQRPELTRLHGLFHHGDSSSSDDRSYHRHRGRGHGSGDDADGSEGGGGEKNEKGGGGQQRQRQRQRDSWPDHGLLRTMCLEQHRREQAVRDRWMQADCVSEVAALLPDHVRRVDVDYPLAACGTAAGDVYVVDVETRECLACSSSRQQRQRREEEDDDDDDDADDCAVDREKLKRAREYLFGGFFRPAGTMSLSFLDRLAAEVDGTGRVRLWRHDPASDRLVSQGTVRAASGTVATRVLLDGDNRYLWIGTVDGDLLALSLDRDDLPLALQTKPDAAWKLSGAVLDLSVSPELGCVAAATQNGVELLSLDRDDDDDDDDEDEEDCDEDYYEGNEDGGGGGDGVTLGETLARFHPAAQQAIEHGGGGGVDPGGDRGGGGGGGFRFPLLDFGGGQRRAERQEHEQLRRNHPLSVSFVPDGRGGHSLAVGCMGGGVYVQRLETLRPDEIDPDRPLAGGGKRSPSSLATELRPAHGLACKCLASPGPGLLISAGQDGKMRVWDLQQQQQQHEDCNGNSGHRRHSFSSDQSYRCLYQLNGYKTWLGSLWTDGIRLLSDGSDNNLILHDFGERAQQPPPQPPMEPPPLGGDFFV